MTREDPATKGVLLLTINIIGWPIIMFFITCSDCVMYIRSMRLSWYIDIVKLSTATQKSHIVIEQYTHNEEII